jgi:hypothetical protein
MVDGVAKASLLYDFYGALLTDKQREVMALYHEENLSLSEIAQEFGISRQGVHDTLKKAEQALEDYENKLMLIDKFVKREEVISVIDTEIIEIEKSPAVAGETEVLDRLNKIKAVIGSLEE